MDSRLRPYAVILSTAAVVVAPLSLTAQPADAAPANTVVVTTTAGNGWSTATENPGLGSVSTVADATSPYPGNAVLMATGPGDPANNKGGKPYLLDGSYGDTPLTSITSLGYSTDVLSIPQPGLAPALNLSVSSDAGWQGTMVYEPYYQSQTPTTGAWQTWDVTASDALWWFSRDVLNPDGSVLYPRQSTHPMTDFLAAFAAYPAKYSNLRLDPRGGGLQISFGQTAYNVGTSNMSALVDGVTFGTSSATTYDFETGIGACLADISGLTYTLTQNCRTTSTIAFPDGATLDGAGYTITAVENSASPNFAGGVVKSATGTDAAAASFDVKNLHIDSEFSGSNSGGVLNGIEMLRAGGSITDVTVDGITHGNGVQEGNGIAVRNRVSGDNIDVPRAAVAVHHVTVTNYQKTGVLLDGNLRVDVSDVHVGQAGTMAGDPMPTHTNGSNGLQLSRGVSGTVTDSTFTNNSYDGQTATAVLVYNARTINFSRNIITGQNADDGLVALDVSNTLDTALTATCNLVENTAATPAPTSTGILIDVADSKPGALSATLADNTSSGWGAPDVPAAQDAGSGDCDAPAPDVSAVGGLRSVSVSWQQDTLPPYAPALQSYVVSLTSSGHPTLTQVVGPNASSATFSHLPQGIDYTATVTAQNSSGDSHGTADVGGSITTVKHALQHPAEGQPARLRGVVTTVSGAPIASGTVRLRAHLHGAPGWTTVATGTTSANGHFALSAVPVHATRYRVVYAGGPHVSSRSPGIGVHIRH